MNIQAKLLSDVLDFAIDKTRSFPSYPEDAIKQEAMDLLEELNDSYKEDNKC